MKTGKVYLVGAGPGDDGLMTIKGMDCLKSADVLVYDRLVNPRLIKEVPETCQLIYVGKAACNHAMPQEEINTLLVKLAKENKTVVRLKGGDPYVFGRGAEEGETLAAANIPFEVIPGVTSAIGGLAYAGIPITHRACASSFHVITAHLKNDSHQLDWQTLAKLEGTLVFLMGASSLNHISEGLINHGKFAKTPVALIHAATTPAQKVTTTTLQDMVKVKAMSPVLIVVGEVVNYRESLNFFETLPLFGKTIAITRAKKQNGQLVQQLSRLGAHVIEVPTIKILPLTDQRLLENEINRMKDHHYLLFTSVNSVDIFFATMKKMRLDSRHLGHIKIVAIGKQTNAQLMNHGIIADLMPTEATLEGVSQLLLPRVRENDRLLIPKAKQTRSILTETLPCKITEVITYETHIPQQENEALSTFLMAETVDFMTFSSASTVTNLLSMLTPEEVEKLQTVKLMSLGPITSKTIIDAGLDVFKVAKEATIDALVKEIIQAVQEEKNHDA